MRLLKSIIIKCYLYNNKIMILICQMGKMNSAVIQLNGLYFVISVWFGLANFAKKITKQLIPITHFKRERISFDWSSKKNNPTSNNSKGCRLSWITKSSSPFLKTQRTATGIYSQSEKSKKSLQHM